MSNEELNPEDQGNPDEEPVRFTDKRKVDPETGAVRGEGTGDTDGVDADGEDALSQAEQILDAAGLDSDAAEEAASDPQAEELKTDLLRLQAEFTNYRRRVERDKTQAKENGLNSAVSALIPVLDDIEAARSAGDLADGPFAAIATKLDTALAGLGLERVDEVGVEFDPAIHEALLRQPVPDVPADHVGMVLRVGFKRGDRVLRAAHHNTYTNLMRWRRLHGQPGLGGQGLLRGTRRLQGRGLRHDQEGVPQAGTRESPGHQPWGCRCRAAVQGHHRGELGAFRSRGTPAV
jgi:molecular chaperone GrpE